MTDKRLRNNNRKKIPLEEFLVKSDRRRNNTQIKKKLLQEGLIKNECSICGQPPFWNGQPLVLEIDHINGDNTDNRLENIRLVCPNCHSQTPTFAGRNVRKQNLKNIPPKLKLIDMIQNMTIKNIALKFEVDKKIVQRWLTHYNIKVCEYYYQDGQRIRRDILKRPDELNYRFTGGPRPDKRKVNRPDKETLAQMIQTTPFTTIAKQYGVSDKAVRRWVVAYGIEIPGKRWGFRKSN